jgi:hypothetical protein
MPVPKIPSLTSTNSKAAAISSSSAGGSSGIGPPPSDDQDWRGSSQAGLSGNSVCVFLAECCHSRYLILTLYRAVATLQLCRRS